MICFDSRKIKEGDTFICLPNARQFINEAVRNGATEVIYLKRKEMAEYSAKYFDNPSNKLKVIGITGTNGKTTTVNLIAHILKENGHKPHIIGTLSNRLTTPESIELQQIMNEKWSKGYTHIVMEVSSIGIDQLRVNNINFDIKILTNITQDHLDYHNTFENYKNTKMYFMENMPGKKIMPADFKELELNKSLPLKGKFNRLNAKAAKKACLELGLNTKQIDSALLSAPQVPGRFEEISNNHDRHVFVDYAHTPDGLKNILEGVKEYKQKNCPKANIITVFGCGGDRDKSKRAEMGKIAVNESSYVYITSDNPRTENPKKIIDDITKEILNFNNKYEIIVDRHLAIEQSIYKSKKNDIILIAGKGHEDYQIIGTEKIHLDDREEARKALSKL